MRQQTKNQPMEIKYSNYISRILLIIIVIYIIEFWNYKFKTEIFVFAMSA